jgi:hypothetical protein
MVTKQDSKKPTKTPAIHPARVRYIKLGERGKWEKECLEKGIIRFGFSSATAERFPLCLHRKWDELTQSFIAEGKNRGTVTRFTNETRLFFEDDGTTLWITFVGEKLCWGFVTSIPPERHPDGDGVCRGIDGGWRWKDVDGEPLAKDRLSGALTKLAAYRRTSCDVDVKDYVIHRINGLKSPVVERALAARVEMIASTLGLMKLLLPRDFELLVDLVFTTSGWRRLGVVGKTQKTIDLVLMLPSTGERAFVQVKSHTTSAELAEYVGQLEGTLYDQMFYVFHSGEAKTDDERVIVMGPERIAEMVLDAGLVNWLIDKVS